MFTSLCSFVALAQRGGYCSYREPKHATHIRFTRPSRYGHGLRSNDDRLACLPAFPMPPFRQVIRLPQSLSSNIAPSPADTATTSVQIRLMRRVENRSNGIPAKFTHSRAFVAHFGTTAARRSARLAETLWRVAGTRPWEIAIAPAW